MTEVPTKTLISPRPIMTVHPGATTEKTWIRRVLIGLALSFVVVTLVLPLLMVGYEAFRSGWQVYLASVTEADALAAIKLTILVAAIAVPLNLIFGLAAAWAVTKFEFVGKRLLMTCIDVPFSVSPVIAGLVFILLFGRDSWLGSVLADVGIQVVFSLPGIVLATVFVTCPFIARELIALMQSQGTDEEEAARALGASGWRIFFSITLPNIKWALLYGVILCNARAMGDFGAVSVVSGHIRGVTNTLPLHVEVVYNEYQFSAAFACASLLALLAIATLIIKQVFHTNLSREK